MNVFVLAKWGGTARWAEDAVADLRFAGQTVHTFSTRNPKIHPSLERLLLSPSIGAPLCGRLIRMMRRVRPDLILGIGAYDDVSEIIFRRLSAVPDHPPLVAWIGDMFSAARADIASRFDLVAYTDTGFLDLHDRLGFRSRRAYIPLAASRATLRHDVGVAQRIPRLAFVAAETRNRREILNRLPEAVDLYGPGWGEGADLSPHNLTSRLVDGEALARIYATHVAALNIRNGNNVINGMNQRHFAPYLQGAPCRQRLSKRHRGVFRRGRRDVALRRCGPAGGHLPRCTPASKLGGRDRRSGTAPRARTPHLFGSPRGHRAHPRPARRLGRDRLSGNACRTPRVFLCTVAFLQAAAQARLRPDPRRPSP